MSIHQHVAYSWENVEVSLEERQCHTPFVRKLSNKSILHGVSGVAYGGELMAIMGASGAGKSTLLNCLTYRTMRKLNVSGQRYLNGNVITADSFTRISGYVQQDDLFVGCLTVKEHLSFQASLRMDKNLTSKERMQRVGEVMNELGLFKCSENVIGDPERAIKGISGGERRRLSFASEVLTNPQLLFCDEPTSGLDSYMAESVVQALKMLASSGKIVICTIHQPSPEVYSLFDRILLMAEGRTAFLGPIDQALPFFESQGLRCPVNLIPADFFIRSLAIVREREQESKEKTKQICDSFDSSTYGVNLASALELNRPAVLPADLPDAISYKKSPYKASWATQFKVVLKRSLTTVYREPFVNHLKPAVIVLFGLLIGLVYQGQSMENVMNINGVLFLLLTNLSFMQVYSVVDTFTMETPIFLREHQNGMYRTDVYLISKMIADLPAHILYPFVAIAIPYYIIGLNPDVECFFTAASIFSIVANVATSYGYLISCMSSSVKVANNLAAPSIGPLMLFGGFFLNNGSVPFYFQWVRYLSWFMYGNEALSINQWSGVSFNETVCQANAMTTPGCHGNDILTELSFNQDFFWRDICCLFVLLLSYRILAFLALLHKARRT